MDIQQSESLLRHSCAPSSEYMRTKSCFGSIFSSATASRKSLPQGMSSKTLIFCVRHISLKRASNFSDRYSSFWAVSGSRASACRTNALGIVERWRAARPVDSKRSFYQRGQRRSSRRGPVKARQLLSHISLSMTRIPVSSASIFCSSCIRGRGPSSG